MGWSEFRDRTTRDEWRSALLERQAGLCALCRQRFPGEGELHPSADAAWRLTFDHIVPKAQGGLDTLDNLQAVHYICNVRKGDGSQERPVPPAPRVLRSEADGVRRIEKHG
jgi:5-methylcytosine-specific restriction endonuclease McrA